MTRYKISNKNSYGFLDCFFQSLLLGAAVMVLCSLLVELSAYRGQIGRAHV